MRKLFLTFFLAIALVLTGCGSMPSADNSQVNTEIRGYCKTPEQAYQEGKSGELLSKEKPIKDTVDTIKVNDDVSIWVATKEDNTLLLAPMMTSSEGYYFNGRETNYYIPDISSECDEFDFWFKYNLKDNTSLRMTVFKGSSYNGKDADNKVNLEIDNQDYMLVYKIS